jgi:hypothetical protein
MSREGVIGNPVLVRETLMALSAEEKRASTSEACGLERDHLKLNRHRALDLW